MLPWMTAELDEIDEVFGGDPWPYGIEPNRPTLEALVTYLAEQNLIAKKMPLEEIFVPIYGSIDADDRAPRATTQPDAAPNMRWRTHLDRFIVAGRDRRAVAGRRA